MHEPNWMIQTFVGILISSIVTGFGTFFLAQWRIEKKLRRVLGIPESSQETAQAQNQNTFNTYIGTAVTQTNQRITVHGRFDYADQQHTAILNQISAADNKVANLICYASEARLAVHNAGSLGENLKGTIDILNKTILDYADAQVQIADLHAKLTNMEAQYSKLQQANAMLQQDLDDLTYECQAAETEYDDFER